MEGARKMDAHMKSTIDDRVQMTMKALEANGMPAFYAADSHEAVKMVQYFMKKGDVISCGGSVTLKKSGIQDLMKSGDYNFLDRESAGKTGEEIYHQALNCDVYLTGTNAITEKGELYNVDGNGNRVAALVYGPEKVLVVAGINKIVRDLDAAVFRVKTVAAPANGKRLQKDTPCAKTGRCIYPDSSDMTKGCSSEGRMCRHFLVTGKQIKKRIHVILIGESLGY